MKSPLIHLMIMGILSVAAVTGYSFWYTMVSNKSNEVVDLQNQIVTATETMNHIASARTMLAEISGDEAKMQSYFIREADIPAFNDYLESLGRPENATVSIISVAPGGSSAQPTFLITLTIGGAFDAVMTTVGAMEYAPYDISLSALSVTQSGKDNWQASVSLIASSMPTATASTTPL
jgi:hypothetical protein